MINTTGMLYDLYMVNRNFDLMSVHFKHQDENLVIVSYQKNREPWAILKTSRPVVYVSLLKALEIHDKYLRAGYRKSMIMTPVMRDVDEAVCVFDGTE